MVLWITGCAVKIGGFTNGSRDLFSEIFRMLPETPNLICLVPHEPAGKKEGRIAAKALAASVMRNLPVAEVKVLRSAEAMAQGGLFKGEKAGLWEVEAGIHGGGLATDDCCGGAHLGHAQEAAPWEMAEALGEVSGYPWVLWLGAGSLVLRGVDHLLAGKADILWAPLPGVPVTGKRCGYYIREEELAEGFRPQHPQSRPWREAASAVVWAMRGERFAEVMAEWRRIFEGAASPGDLSGGGDASGGTRHARPTQNKVESAWNRLLLDTPLRVARFERDEVQFPCLPGADLLKWKDACILNVGDWPQDAQRKFLQAWFYGTYFADPTGLFLDIVEP